MRSYKFTKIAARCFPTIADLNNPWIFQDDVALVINVSQRTDSEIESAIKARGCRYTHIPLNEEVDDMGWANILRAVTELLE